MPPRFRKKRGTKFLPKSLEGDPRRKRKPLREKQAKESQETHAFIGSKKKGGRGGGMGESRGGGGKKRRQAGLGVYKSGSFL